MGRLGSSLLKGLGALVLVLVALGVIATIVGIALSVVATVVSIVVSVVVLGLFVLAAVGLASLLRTDAPNDADTDGRSPHDRESRLRERYVAGELTDAEFERELDRLLERDDTDYESDRSRDLDRARR